MQFQTLLKDTNQLKLKQLPQPGLSQDNSFYALPPSLKNLLNEMMEAFKLDISIEETNSLHIDKIKRLFINFDKKYNDVTSSKFMSELQTMKPMSFRLMIRNEMIRLNFLIKRDPDFEYVIASIIHSINTFCHLFPSDYQKLTIYICLDHNKREISPTILEKMSNNHDRNEIFSHLQRRSGAFTVGGVTQKADNMIIITKMEETIKLLFHELVHYIGLDHELMHRQIGNLNFSIQKTNLNLSEVYTEFMAILLNAAYHAIHLYGLCGGEDPHQIFYDLLYLETQYSFYLTSNILKFYGYDKNTFRNFFQNKGLKYDNPIAIWEYVIVRTQLLLNLPEVTDLVGDDWYVHGQHTDSLIHLMKIDNYFLKILENYMDLPLIHNFSYTLIDFNWSLL